VVPKKGRKTVVVVVVAYYSDVMWKKTKNSICQFSIVVSSLCRNRRRGEKGAGVVRPNATNSAGSTTAGYTDVEGEREDEPVCRERAV